MTITTLDGALHLLDTGSGPPVVFVHGTPSSSVEFRHVAEILADEHRCIAVDHLGFGRSDKPAHADYSIVGHQRRFATAMDRLALEPRCSCCTTSAPRSPFPGCSHIPTRCAAVVLANTFLWGAEGPMRWVMAFYATALGRWIYRATNLSARWLLPLAWGRHRPLDPATHALYLEPFRRASHRHATSALPGELVGETLGRLRDSASLLQRWPVHAVWGMADPLVGADALARWREVLPRLVVEEVTDAGHFVADEAPDVVASAVRTLMSEAPAWEQSRLPA